MVNIYLDIETIPSQLSWVKDHVSQDVKPPATIKKQETLDKWYEENYGDVVEKAMEKTTFDGAMNHIICIGLAVDDENPISFSAPTYDDEKNIIQCMYDWINMTSEFGRIFVGHNITGFDMRIIRQRSIVLGVKPSKNMPFSAKPWDANPFDTMTQWDTKNFTKQDVLAKAFGISPKADLDGSKVYQYWKEGRHDEIAEYCKNDVVTVREIYKRMQIVNT